MKKILDNIDIDTSDLEEGQPELEERLAKVNKNTMYP